MGLYSKLLLVLMAFVLMIFSSCLCFINILQRHIEMEAVNMLTQSKMKIETDIIVAETILTNVSDSIHEIILRGGSEEEVLDCMKRFTADIRKNEKKKKLYYSKTFGYFEVFEGKYLDGSGWKPPEGYNPRESPWYKEAVENKGNITIVPLYLAVDTNQYSMSYVTSVLDNEENLMYILGLDIPLNSVSEYVSEMKLTENSYGMLQSSESVVIAHPKQEFLGVGMVEINQGLYQFLEDNDTAEIIPMYRTVNSDGKKMVVFTTRISNGGYLSVVIPVNEYFQEMVHMVVMISVLGLILALTLMAILVRIDREKNKAEEEARQQGELLVAMQKAREAEERTQLLLDATPMSCKLWTRDMRILTCNEEAVRVFGVSSKQEFCERFYEFSPKYQPNGRTSMEMAREELDKAFKEGSTRFEWMHRKHDGQLIPSEITLVRVAHDHDYVCAGYIRDLTEHYLMMDELNDAADELRYSRDLAQSANNAKSAFLANMSHEMRTPLNVIVGLTDLRMEDEDLSESIFSDIKKINNAGNILLSIVNDVLDISKIEAGKLELMPTEYNAASLFNDVITLNVFRIESKPVTFEIDIDENLPANILGDELRLKQILNNLLSNAFKYTHNGNVKLSVRQETADNKDIWVTISVQDTGIGIRPDDLRKLFSDYNQVDMMANRHIEGTGLGLSIAKRLVELMDGEISVESEYGKGTTFTVRLRQGFISGEPLGRDTVENLSSFSYSDNKKHYSSKLMRLDMSYAKVLVVDDFPTNLDVASGMMRKYKMQVDCVLSGQEAIDSIAGEEPRYDAIFMDHMMPGMDGIEATKRIRGLGTEYAATVPIISLTANAIAGNEKMFLESGFQAFLSKPIDILKLDLILRTWVRDKSRELLLSADLPPLGPEPEEQDQTVAIAGIDDQKGLSLYGNDLELFMTVLRSYAANTPAVIDSLRQVTNEDLSAYATNVHGLKGSSGSIGAESVREKAAGMEKAAKEGDLSTVLAENETLLDEAQSLVTAIKDWLYKRDGGSEKSRLSSPDPALLASIRKCCEEFDMNGADRVMEQLESACYDQDNDLIIWLREKVDISDFPAITERIKQYEEGET